MPLAHGTAPTRLLRHAHMPPPATLYYCGLILPTTGLPPLPLSVGGQLLLQPRFVLLVRTTHSPPGLPTTGPRRFRTHFTSCPHRVPVLPARFPVPVPFTYTRYRTCVDVAFLDLPVDYTRFCASDYAPVPRLFPVGHHRLHCRTLPPYPLHTPPEPLYIRAFFVLRVRLNPRVTPAPPALPSPAPAGPVSTHGTLFGCVAAFTPPLHNVTVVLRTPPLHATLWFALLRFCPLPHARGACRLGSVSFPPAPYPTPHPPHRLVSSLPHPTPTVSPRWAVTPGWWVSPAQPVTPPHGFFVVRVTRCVILCRRLAFTPFTCGYV